MNGWGRLAVTVAMAALSVGESALAETSGQWATCTDGAAPSRERQIAACTAVIRSRQSAKAELAVVYYNRGHAYAEKNWPLRARADFERALELRPNYPEALLSRGEILAQRNKWRQASGTTIARSG